MLRIGITGGLGSGKSTVAHIFEVLGIPVYYADTASKRLMNEDDEIKSSIQNAFGQAAYTKRKLNTKYVSDIVFKDKGKLAILNSIVHPATLIDAAEWMNNQKSFYALKEAALIFESGSNKSLDYVIGVKAPLEMRLQRAMFRDTITIEEAMARINQQMNEEDKLELCDYIIVNDEQQILIPQVLALHQKFLNMK
ncbi:MAG: dephospho-CoA kinase [Chitinophagaceae bacterium]